MSSTNQTKLEANLEAQRKAQIANLNRQFQTIALTALGSRIKCGDTPEDAVAYAVKCAELMMDEFYKPASNEGNND